MSRRVSFLTPNVRANRTPAVGWLGPGWRKCTACRQTGPRQPAVGGPVVQRGVRPRPDYCWRREWHLTDPRGRAAPLRSRVLAARGFKPPHRCAAMHSTAAFGGSENWPWCTCPGADDFSDMADRPLVLVAR